MKRIVIPFAVLALLVGAVIPSGTAVAQDQPPTAAQIRELLVVTNAEKMAFTMSSQMVKSIMQAVRARVPPKERQLLEQVEQEIGGVMAPFVKMFAEAVIPLYQKHFTAREIGAAIAFYKTPEGQSMIRKMPAIMGESMQLGMTVGRQLGAAAVEKARARLRAKGYNL